jgi:hypothetical protein
MHIKVQNYKHATEPTNSSEKRFDCSIFFISTVHFYLFDRVIWIRSYLEANGLTWICMCNSVKLQIRHSCFNVCTAPIMENKCLQNHSSISSTRFVHIYNAIIVARISKSTQLYSKTSRREATLKPRKCTFQCQNQPMQYFTICFMTNRRPLLHILCNHR